MHSVALGVRIFFHCDESLCGEGEVPGFWAGEEEEEEEEEEDEDNVEVRNWVLFKFVVCRTIILSNLKNTGIGTIFWCLLRPPHPIL